MGVTLDIPSIVMVARDAALEERGWEDDGSLEAALVRLAYTAARTALADGPDIPDVAMLERVTRYLINADPQQLTDEQLLERYIFDTRQHVRSRQISTEREMWRRRPHGGWDLLNVPNLPPASAEGRGRR